MSHGNHEAWSRMLQRSVRLRQSGHTFWVISLCKSLRIWSFVSGRDKVRLYILSVCARCSHWARSRCHLLNLFVAIQRNKKQNKKTKKNRKKRREFNQSRRQWSAKQSSCNPRQWAMYYISRQLFMRPQVRNKKSPAFNWWLRRAGSGRGRGGAGEGLLSWDAVAFVAAGLKIVLKQLGAKP